jgi:hypothetical protein
VHERDRVVAAAQRIDPASADARFEAGWRSLQTAMQAADRARPSLITCMVEQPRS